MRIVVVGGTGLIGTHVVRLLTEQGHDVVTAARSTGVNSFTGIGLEEALDGADVIVDTSNSSYTDAAAAAEFFEVSTINLLSFGRAAGVRHHVALSVVGTDRLAASHGGYFAAKLLQERLLTESGVPFSIVHATQFFEFLRAIADDAQVGGEVRVAHAQVQPMAAVDVAAAVAAVAVGEPRGGIVENAGPEQFRLDDAVRRGIAMLRDPREVVPDPLARYFGAELTESELLPSADATLWPTRFDDWLGER